MFTFLKEKHVFPDEGHTSGGGSSSSCSGASKSSGGTHSSSSSIRSPPTVHLQHGVRQPTFPESTITIRTIRHHLCAIQRGGGQGLITLINLQTRPLHGRRQGGTRRTGPTSLQVDTLDESTGVETPLKRDREAQCRCYAKAKDTHRRRVQQPG